MPIGTFEQYHERLLKIRPSIYVGGKVTDRSSPLIDSGLYVIRQASDCACDERHREFYTVTSHLAGGMINRSTHIHQTEDDLLKKRKTTKFLSHRVGGCIQRCMRIDTLNALSVVTCETDQALGTTYNEDLLKYLARCQEHDIVANCVQTDVKSDRMRQPSEQANPNMYLHTVETRPDGIIVRGAKSYNSSAPYVDEIIVAPIRFMEPSDRDYAVSFAIPADQERVKLVALSGVRHKKNHTDAPIAHVGDMGSLIVFGGVFVPNDRVFMNGHADPRQAPYTEFLALIFAYFHRHSYMGCEPVISEMLASISALVAEYDGVEKQSHVKGKLTHIISIAEMVFACGIASTIKSQKSPSGTYIPNGILMNTGRELAGEEIYNENKILAGLAGGLIATIPMEAEYYSDEVDELLNKYIMRNPNISAENVHRCSRMVEDQTLSEFGGGMIVAGLCGDGSPIMEEVAMMSRYPLEELKGIAEYLTGIESEIPVLNRQYVTPRKILEKFAKYTKQTK